MKRPAGATVCSKGHDLTEANTYRVQGRRRCRICCASKIKAWRFAHRSDPSYVARRNASATGSYRRHRAVFLARARAHRIGGAPEDFDRLLVEQGGLCAMCRTAAACVFDHNHTTGQRRSLLCNRCNLFLGYCEKTPALLTAAIVYLKRWAR